MNGSSRPTDQLAALRAADFDIAEDQEIANVAGEVTATPKTVGTTRRSSSQNGLATSRVGMLAMRSSAWTSLQIGGASRGQLYQDGNSRQRQRLLRSMSQTDERVERLQAAFLYATREDQTY